MTVVSRFYCCVVFLFGVRIFCCFCFLVLARSTISSLELLYQGTQARLTHCTLLLQGSSCCYNLLDDRIYKPPHIYMSHAY
ncbi:hypothetical protein Hdeb2414_s0255g00849121 [Helianthus debilis subsp. tardiflorus]